MPYLSLILTRFFVGVCFVLPLNLLAQEQLGLRLDNYSGANAIALNPAAHATYPLSWDINLIGLGFSVHNSLAYIEKTTLGKTIRNRNRIGPDPALNIGFNGTPLLEYNFRTQNQYSGSAIARVMTPSFIIRHHSGHSFGLFTGFRAMLTSHSIPKIANPYEIQQIRRGQTFDIAPFKLRALSWTELGINYAYTIGVDTEGGVTLGVNVKHLQGFQGVFADNFSGTKMTRLSRDSLRVDNLKAQFGYTINYDDHVENANGSGWGFDIGAMMTIPAPDDRPYEWRLGAALLDLGRINMTKNTEVHVFSTKEVFEIYEADFQNLNEQDPLNDALQRFNLRAFNNPKGSLKGNSMPFSMPAALQLQADYAFTKNLFVNGFLIQRLPFGQNVLSRDNLLAFTPRYESRWLGASLPISIWNYQQLRIGLAARLAFLTVGTDNLFSFMMPTNLYGTDFYVALKVNPFSLGLLSDSGSRNRGGKWGKNKKVDCYKF